MKDLVSILGFLSLVVLLSNCKDPENPLPKDDFFKFKLNNRERIYLFADSSSNYCQPTVNNKNLFLFDVSKFYPSSDNEFISLTLSVRKDSAAICPEATLDQNAKFDFVLTRKANDTKHLVDFRNNSLYIDHCSWSQAYVDNKIIVSGELRGWLYQEYVYRPESQWQLPMEPMRFDSLFIENARFQFTIN